MVADTPFGQSAFVQHCVWVPMLKLLGYRTFSCLCYLCYLFYLFYLFNLILSKMFQHDHLLFGEGTDKTAGKVFFC